MNEEPAPMNDQPNGAEAGRPAQVALVCCEEYDETAVYEAVGRGLALLGGAGRFVQPGETILLKPNLLVFSTPGQAVTTHPAVFGAVARHLQAAGAHLSYGDSPAFGRTVDVARFCGLAEVASQLEIPLADFGAGQTVSFPEGGLAKKFSIAEGVLAADGIVSLPKFKTHGLTRFTGSVKNQFGCIPGLLKSEFHVRLQDQERFCQMLVDLNRLLHPRLYVMDGIVAMEGNGPRGGDPRTMSVLLLSDDPVALDATACRMIDLDISLVPTNTWGEAWGLGQAHQVEILGDPLESFAAPDFSANRQKGSTTGEPGRLSGLLKQWLVPRPAIQPANCTRCGTCVQACPVSPKAVDFRSANGRKQPPSYDYGLCIRCYCCQEMCPERAIEIETPLLGRLIRR
jgi:uncharacterized protein (DUF362 family)/Pyruvate/2-oxoacid:ferredoxin oxidoreductase delta subunit